MGGEIGVESAPGEGSTFWFTIRCELGHPVTIAETSPEISKMDEIESLRILVAEDNHVNQMILENLLLKLDYQVSLCSNGDQAVALSGNEDFAAILMDCQMPVMDGYEATRHIRESEGCNRDVPIIAITANAMSGDRQFCLDSGMNDYLSKPVKAQQINACLLYWLNT